jgi:Icc-related predicted phosphoesterase
MKILCFVDLHEHLGALSDIERKSKNADVVVCAGDLSTFERNLDYALHRLGKLKIPVLLIAGNHESDSLVRTLCKQYKNMVYLERRHHLIGSTLFVGCQGNGFARDDPAFASATLGFPKKIKECRIKFGEEFRCVLVTHAAPYNTKLDKIYGGHHGNRTIRKFIEQTKPDLVVCGHFHETAGKEDRIGKSLVINPGPRGKIVTL